MNVSRIPKRRTALAPAALAALLVLPAAAAAHPAVYEVERKLLAKPVGTCNFTDNPSGACFTSGPKRYVVVNHNIPVAYDETNGLTESYGGVINFQRFPGAFRETIPSPPVGYLGVEPAKSGVQPHATCESTATSAAANVVGWQGAEPFYAYIPWQSTSAGIDDDPAEWIGYVKAKTGVDLSGMGAAAAETACESLPGATADSYHPADTPLATSIASGLVAHEVEHAVAPLQEQIDALAGEKSSLQAQIDAWKSKGAALESQVAALTGARGAMERQLAASSQANAKLRKANARKAKTIKRLREQLRAEVQHG